jgi:N-formylglutamate amidohydrolase
MTLNPYRLHLPQARTSAIVVASPHSGRDYSHGFMASSVLDPLGIRSSEDAFVDDLVARVPEFGAPLLLAHAPRAYVDLNRAAEELDPAVIADIPRGVLNPRVSSGLGVIPRVVANGRAIYHGKISRAEAAHRIDTIWAPYHARLQTLLTQSRAQFGHAVLIDVHSMPHEAIESVRTGNNQTPQIVLGDRFGASCASDITDQVEAAFVAAGLRVARNQPFAGAYITQHYGRPSKGQHALQIEIDRALYMDEHTVTPSGNFAGFQRIMTQVMRDIVEIGRGQVQPLAAE